MMFFFFFQAEDGIRDADVTGVQTCALPILLTGAAARTSCRQARRSRASSYGTRVWVSARGSKIGLDRDRFWKQPPTEARSRTGMRLREIGRTSFLFHSQFYSSDGRYTNAE